MCWINDNANDRLRWPILPEMPPSQRITTDEYKIALLEKLIKEGKISLSDGLKLLQV